jgi:hypothetical protein
LATFAKVAQHLIAVFSLICFALGLPLTARVFLPVDSDVVRANDEDHHMFKSLFLPVILMTMVGGPMLYSRSQRTAQFQPDPFPTAPFPTSANQFAGNVNLPNPIPGLPAQNLPSQSLPMQNGQTYGQPQRPPHQLQTAFQHGSIQPAASQSPTLQSAPVPQFNRASVTTGTVTNANQMVFNQQEWNQPGMVPDYGRTETLVFPGDANGPDLNAKPMSFVPVADFATLFRFDLTKDWVTSRWDRVSTTPADRGLHGMRVALVTGTNSWDLHGSLTYFFDANHRVQRISFRGWTGDANRLLQTVAGPYQLRPQPTHWAGLYVSKNSGLLMKHPAVIDKSNPVQRLALVLELNNPEGRTQISEEFKSFLQPAMAVQ